MDFGLLWEMQLGDKPWPEHAAHQIYWDAIEEAKLAERVGFSHVWVPEHHFLTGYSHSSAPEVWLSALAQHTSTIRIGHGVVLLPTPFNPPFHIAERVAMLDVLSNGRVEFGTGRGATASELDGYGVDTGDSRGMWEEVLHQVPKMWADGPYPGHQGKYVNLPSREIWPKPVQKPHPPMWMAASSPESFEYAGRNGIGILCFVIGHPDKLSPLIRIYRDAIRDCTNPAGSINNQVACYVLAHVAEDRAEARKHGGAACGYYTEQIFQLFGTVQGKPGYEVYEKVCGDAAVELGALAEKYGNMIDPLIDLGVICVGDPEDAANIIAGFAVQDVDQIITTHQIGGLPHEKVMRSIELFGEHVIPGFTGPLAEVATSA